MIGMTNTVVRADNPSNIPSTKGAFETKNNENLILTIKLKQPVVTKGKYIQISATITNKGNEPVTLVKPGDGSSYGWRTPITALSVLSESDKKVSHPKNPKLFNLPRCGNINPLRANEVVTLNKGESVKLNQWAGYKKMDKVGTYRVVFYYNNQPTLKWRGLPLGKHDEAAMKKVKASTPCKLISNEVTFKIVD